MIVGFSTKAWEDYQKIRTMPLQNSFIMPTIRVGYQSVQLYTNESSLEAN